MKITIIIFLFFITETIAISSCSKSKQILFFFPDPQLNSSVAPGFDTTLFSGLYPQLLDIGYCLYWPENLSSYLDSSSLSDNPLMYVCVREIPQNNESFIDAQSQLVVSVISLKAFSPEELEKSLTQPLVAIASSFEELPNLTSVLVKKIIENLRTHYICNLTINSEPAGAVIRSEGGLEGVTPIKWVLPVSKFSIYCLAPGHLTLKRQILLEHPGDYTYFLQLKKRQFYHSKFIYPSVVCCVCAIGFYGVEKYYFDKYLALGEKEFYSNPAVFESTFNKAKTAERLTIVSVAAASLFLGMSFWF